MHLSFHPFRVPMLPVSVFVQGPSPRPFHSFLRPHVACAALPDYVTERKTRHVCDNKRANFEFELLERYECGVELKGSEVKSVFNGQVSLLESFCRVQAGELFLLNANIAKYGNSYDQQPEKRRRKLLVHKRELLKLKARQDESGLTIVPTKMYFRGPYLKLEIAVARGKKLYDKREDIKRREGERDIQRAMKVQNYL